MSASWSSNQNRQRRRRPRRSAVPIEIEAIKTPPRSPVSSASKNTSCMEKSSTVHGTGACSVWERTFTKVEILPGSLLIPEGEPWLHPPEPLEPPPLPTEIVQFLVLGQHFSGKTTLSRRFERMHCKHYISKNKKASGKNPSSQWSVEYHKQDVTFWHAANNTIGCARVQLWDVAGGGPSDKPLERRPEWIRLVQKMSGILLVVSLEHGPNALFEIIASWKQWLDECCPSHAQVHLFLQKCDMLPSQTINPIVWMELGARISKLCDETGICDWRMTTCCTDAAAQSPEQAIMELVQTLVTTSVPQKKVSFQPSPARSVSRVSRRELGHKLAS